MADGCGKLMRHPCHTKRATLHTLRCSSAAYLLEDGRDIRTVQELLGHQGVATSVARDRM